MAELWTPLLEGCLYLFVFTNLGRAAVLTHRGTGWVTAWWVAFAAWRAVATPGLMPLVRRLNRRLGGIRREEAGG